MRLFRSALYILTMALLLHPASPSSLDMAILQYLPLVQQRDIRLIDILPGAPTDALRIKIYHCTLSETSPPAFEALSYVWGLTDNLVLIYVQVGLDSDALEFPVGQNLDAALRHVRHADTTRTVWADAICINQKDYAERSQQVLIMGDIYRLARKVVAFLGPDGDDSSYALELLEKLANMVDVDFGSGLISPSAAGSSEPSWADIKLALPYDRRELLAIHHLIRRDWFERLWIRQEIGLSGREGVLLCGTRELSWPLFCKAIFVLQRKPAVVGILDAAQTRTYRDRVHKVDTVALYSMRAFSFLNLRRQIGLSKCSDQRDRIYAVLSHLRKSDHLGIVPDYNKTASEVYVDAAQRHIRQSGRLAILCQCELDESTSATPLPSWVPDWANPMPSAGVHEFGTELFELLPTFEDMNNERLQAYGVSISRVTQVMPINDKALHGESDAEMAQELRKLLFEADRHGAGHAYTSRERVLEAYCRSLWLNNFADRWQPAVPHEPPYKDCLRLVKALVDPENATAELPSLPNISYYLSRARDACTARTLYTTEEGHVGMGPASVAVGDEVCHLFGSWKPIILRPVASKEHRVVGECYIHGRMHGEAVLGELPENLRNLLNSHSLGGLQSAGFIDMETKVVYKDDPRMLPFLTRLVANGLVGNATLDELKQVGAIDALTKAGVPINLFSLV